MRKFIIIFGIIITVTYFVRAFDSHAILANPPKRSIADAYSLATQALGTDTNRFYCVSATIDRDWREHGAWVFNFENNGLWHKMVYVAMMQQYDFALGKPGPLTVVIVDVDHSWNPTKFTTNSISIPQK